MYNSLQHVLASAIARPYPWANPSLEFYLKPIPVIIELPHPCMFFFCMNADRSA